jgi:glutamate-5-semialdehyde dehydrogenase
MSSELRSLAEKARRAARPLARATAAQRTRAIEAVAEQLLGDRHAIEAANAEDLARAREAGLAAAMLDRLELRGPRLTGLASALRDIAALPDPVGAVSREWARPNGLVVRKVRLPLGVILMIYESRPNVTVDAAALCIRSGNAVLLRGGSEASRTNAALMACVRAGLAVVGLPEDAAQLVPTQARDAIDLLVTFDDCIDLVIPRGGEGLIRRVAEKSRIPVVRHYKGVCHVFVERTADPAMALTILENSKVQRPGVCNATETVLVDAPVASSFLPRAVERLRARGVELRGCERTRAIVADMKPATDLDWDTEFLDLVLAVRVVDGLEGAVAHIDAHGTQHTAAIVTQDPRVADRFTAEIDASCVLVNASTRFNDGGELGLGAEMGISTTRVHAFGPMGVEALTAEKFVVQGSGQVRG